MSPRFLYIELNRRCNLRCQSCDFWRDRRASALTDEQISDAIAEFSDMGGETVVTCGGEASLEGDRFWHLHAQARANRLRSFSVTNGTRVTEANAGRWVTEGPSEITVSLDGPDPDTHDRLRGRPNFFVATDAIRKLLAARKKHATGTRVYAMAVISEHNYRLLPDMYRLVLDELGADKLKLNMAQSTFGWTHAEDWLSGARVKDPVHLMATINGCDARWGLRRNPEWKADVLDYWRAVGSASDIRRMGPARTERQVCNSAERNLWINWKGAVTLCPANYFGAMHFKRRGDLRAAWEGIGRSEMLACKRLCGISHSVRRSTSLEAA